MVCHCKDAEPCEHRDQPAKKDRKFPGEVGYPAFLPRPNDDYAIATREPESMTAEGPWATGRVYLSSNAGLVGIRPVVDRYSVTKYEMRDWRKKNQELLDQAFSTSQDLSSLKGNVKCTIDRISAGADKQQSANTARLEERVKDVRDCQNEIEQLIKDFRQEVVLLTEIKVKLKFSLPTLKMPESIAGECIDIRNNRLEQDLVKDEVEVELVKELAMIKETRDMYERMITEVEKEILATKACKDELESTWSDKKETCELDSINACLRNTTPIISHYAGAVRVQNNQSSPESWAIFNATLINTAKDELKKSRCLREMTEMKVIEESVRQLSIQADKVHTALKKRIEITEQCLDMFQLELEDILKQISDAEALYSGLLKLQRQLDYSSMVVETRMVNRQHRQRVENCRDIPQYGLMDEVKFLNMSKSDLQKQIEEIDYLVAKLYRVRADFENAIMAKKKSLYVDRERCLAYRERYPDTVTLSGGNF